MNRRSVWWPMILVGFLIGLGLGLYYAWQVNPIVVTDIDPAKLAVDAKREYVMAISLAYQRDLRVEIAAEKLALAELDFSDVANYACQMVQEGKATSTAALTAIRSMVQLAMSQGQTSCASQLFVERANTTTAPTVVMSTATNTRIPPASKTPTPTLGVTFTPPAVENTLVPTPGGEFVVDVRAFCNPTGSIEILVQNVDGSGLPGIAVQVDTNVSRQVFFTGLQPEYDLGYADFTMADNDTYVVSLRDFPQTRSRGLESGFCAGDSSQKAAYRVTFRRVAGT